MQHIIFNQYNKSNQKHGFWKFSEGEDFNYEGEYCNGLKVGEWKRYDKKGNLVLVGSYNKTGRKNGVWKWYYRSGELNREVSYKNGTHHGYFRKYWDNGTIYEEGSHVNSKRDGEWKIYQRYNNKIDFIVNYKKNIPIGISTFYDINGNIDREILFII